jgi:hypothetical protein
MACLPRDIVVTQYAAFETGLDDLIGGGSNLGIGGQGNHEAARTQAATSSRNTFPLHAVPTMRCGAGHQRTINRWYSKV